MWRGGIAGAVELAFIMLSASALAACGARSSLTGTEVDPACGPWSVRQGEVGVASSVGAPFAVLGDGRVVLPTSAIIQGKGGAAAGAKSGEYVLELGPDGSVVWDEPLGAGWELRGVARGEAEAPVVLAAVSNGTHTVLGATVTCPGPSWCIVVGKLGATGTMVWSRLVPGENLYPLSLAATPDGRITVEVTFDGTLDLGCGPLTVPAGAAWGSSRALARLSAAGECQWSRAIAGTTALWSTNADRMAVNDDGEIALTMMLPYAEDEEGPQSLDLGGGPIAFDTTTALGVAVAKYANDGSLVFGKVVSGAGLRLQEVLPAAQVALTETGEILLSLTHEGTLDLGGGPQGSPGLVRQFIAGLSAAGEERWSRELSSATSDDIYGRRGAFAIAAEPGGGFYLAGHGQPGMTLLDEPTPETTIFVAAHDAGGEPVSVRRFPFTSRASVVGLHASADALVLAGHFLGTLDFGHGPLVSAGADDLFVARICR